MVRDQGGALNPSCGPAFLYGPWPVVRCWMALSVEDVMKKNFAPGDLAIIISTANPERSSWIGRTVEIVSVCPDWQGCYQITASWLPPVPSPFPFWSIHHWRLMKIGPSSDAPELRHGVDLRLS